MGATTGDICILTHMLDRMPCGVGRYLESLLEEFKTLDLADRIHLVHPHRNDHPHYRHFRHTIVPMYRGKGRETRWTQWCVPRALRRMRPLLVHCPIQTNPPVFGPRAPLVLTVWDFSPIRWKDPGWPWLRRWLVFGLILRRALARAAEIIVPSESTRRDVKRFYGRALARGGAERITIVPCAADDRWRPRPDIERPFPEPYVLYVGSLAPRKNVGTLIRALGILKRHGQARRLLLVVSPEEFIQSGMDALCKAESVSDMIEMRPEVTTDELASLYTHCGAFVFPSLYEGFGLPVLEAMACGAPVITTSRSSLPEVAGDAARLVEGRDPEDLAHAIERVLGDPVLRRSLSDAGRAQATRFSWRRTAEQTAAVYRRVLARSTTNGRRAP